MAESVGYRALITFTHRLSWFLGQALRLRFEVRAVYPRGPLRRRPGEALILALTHEHVLDPWLAVIAFDYRTWRSLAPVRVLGTRDWTGWYHRFRWLFRGLYRLYGVAELPPRSRRAPREEKLRGLLDALARGEVVAIFPEGHVREPGEPPVRPFEPGIAVLHRRSGAPVVPMAIRLDPPHRRLRFTLIVGTPVAIPEGLEPEESAEWLRQRARELYEHSPPAVAPSEG
jgi:1-acyl-sn-glycerol-3-phosphate acyltransferase